MGCLGALPIFVGSVLLEKSEVELFRKIDQDTILYVIQVFGAERNWPVRCFCRSLSCADCVVFSYLFIGVQLVGMQIALVDLRNLFLLFCFAFVFSVMSFFRRGLQSTVAFASWSVSPALFVLSVTNLNSNA